MTGVSRFGALLQAWYRLYAHEGDRRPRPGAIGGAPALGFRRQAGRAPQPPIFRLGVAGAAFDLLELARRIMIAPGLVEAAARAGKVALGEAEAAFHVAGGGARCFDYGDLWAPVGRVYLTFLDNLDRGVMAAPVVRRQWPRYLNLVLSNSEPFAVARRWTVARGGRGGPAIQLRAAGITVGALFERLADRAPLVRKLASGLRLGAAQVRDQLAALPAVLPAGGARSPADLPPPDALEIARLWKTDAAGFAERLRGALDRFLLVPSPSGEQLPARRKSMVVLDAGFVPEQQTAVGQAADKAAAEYLVDTAIISLIATIEDLERLLAALAGSPAQASKLLFVMAHHFFRDPALLAALAASPRYLRYPDQPFAWKAKVAKLLSR